MMDLAKMFAWMQEVAPEARNLLSGAGDYLRQLHVEGAELGTGGVALGLALLWYCARIIRKVVSILFTLCILLLILQLTGVVDLASLWEYVSAWNRPAEA